MTAIEETSGALAPASVPGLAWRGAALATSSWIEQRNGLADLARNLPAENAARRAEVAAHCDDLLHGRPRSARDVSRAAEVGLEVVAQSIALVLDLRDAARESDVPVREWVARRIRTLRNAPQNALEAAALDLQATTPATPDGIALDLTDDALLLELDRDDPASRDLLLAALARRLRICSQTLGPTFVKFGQLLGSAAGLLPDEMTDEFGRCRDRVPPAPAKAVRRSIEDALGPIGTAFASFDDEPLAAASIAQVHAAVLHDGTPVVVKVQRPGIRRRIERDISILRRLVAMTDRVELIETVNLGGMVDLFARTVLEELDFRLEAENAIDVALALESLGADDVVVPRPIPGMVSEKILVMERLDGRRLDADDDRDDILAVLRLGTEAVLETAVLHGLFHGDLHAGNVLALPDGRYGLLDFGIVGRFDEGQRWALLRWLASIPADDLGLQLAALADLGAFGPDVDLDALRDQIETLLTAMGGGPDTIEPSGADELTRHVELLVRVLSTNGLRLPAELSLFFKNLVHVSGAVKLVDRDADPLAQLGGAFDTAHRHWQSAAE